MRIGSWIAAGLALAALPLISVPASANLASCSAQLKSWVISQGVDKEVAEIALGKVVPDEDPVRFSKSQPEFKTPIWDYLAFLVDEQRIADGKRMARQHDRLLRQIEQQYGVDRYVVLGIWGVETNYGVDQGRFFIPHAYANLICAGRRTKFFRGELLAALQIVSRGDLRLADLWGSWAGAFGHTQFIPSTYKRLAVDFDGDGKRDLVRSIPDALASTANYLKKSNWRAGRPWGYEVKVPAGYSGPNGRKQRAPISTWAARGITPLKGRHLNGDISAALLQPAGRNGPSFLVTGNFNAVFSYNFAESYALAISHLGDRIRGEGPIKTAWPTDDPGLSRAQRLDLQKLLNANGFDVGEPDGKVGPMTRAGIRKAEASKGMPETGRAGLKIYRALGGRI